MAILTQHLLSLVDGQGEATLQFTYDSLAHVILDVQVKNTSAKILTVFLRRTNGPVIKQASVAGNGPDVFTSVSVALPSMLLAASHDIAGAAIFMPPFDYAGMLV